MVNTHRTPVEKDETVDITMGIDPGDSTGIAVFDGSVLVYVKQCPSDWALSYIDAFLEAYVKQEANVIIACERYVSLGHGAHSHQPTAQQMIGVIQQLGTKHNVKVIMQGPADARSIADITELKKMGVYVTPNQVEQADANDANMAVRHALFAMATNRARLFDKLIEESKD